MFNAILNLTFYSSKFIYKFLIAMHLSPNSNLQELFVSCDLFEWGKKLRGRMTDGHPHLPPISGVKYWIWRKEFHGCTADISYRLWHCGTQLWLYTHTHLFFPSKMESMKTFHHLIIVHSSYSLSYPVYVHRNIESDS